MLFDDRLVRPATRAVELCDYRFAFIDTDLVDPVFIAIERQRPPIAAQAYTLEGIEHEIGVEVFEGCFAHAAIVRDVMGKLPDC